MLLQVIINSAIKMLLQQNSYCPKLAIVKTVTPYKLGNWTLGCLNCRSLHACWDMERDLKTKILVSLPQERIQEIKRMMMMYSTHGLFF
jgi:hypothetical protein